MPLKGNFGHVQNSTKICTLPKYVLASDPAGKNQNRSIEVICFEGIMGDLGQMELGQNLIKKNELLSFAQHQFDLIPAEAISEQNEFGNGMLLKIVKCEGQKESSQRLVSHGSLTDAINPKGQTKTTKDLNNNLTSNFERSHRIGCGNGLDEQ